MKTSVMSRWKLCWSVGTVCYPELWVSHHILKELIFQSTADKDLWLKNMFKNIVLKKMKNEKQLLAIIECQAIIYVCVFFFIIIILCIIVFEHLHVNTLLIYHFVFVGFWFFFFLLILWMFLCFICIFDQFCSQVEN